MPTLVVAQCFKSTEVGGILKDAERLTKTLDLQALHNEIVLRSIELAEGIPVCKAISTADGQVPVCIVENILTCLNFGGEFAPDELELFNSVATDWRDYIFPSDLIKTNEFCYLTISSKPVINKLVTCNAFITTIQTAIGIESNFASKRLVIKNKSLEGVKDDISGKALCHQTAYLMATMQKDLLQQKKLNTAFEKVNEMVKMVGLTLSNSECGDFIFGSFTVAEITCLKQKLKKSVTRRKRSTLLNLLLGDGARTDSLQNKMHSMTSVINDNSQKLFHNQEQLKILGLANGKTLLELEKRTVFSEAITLAHIHHMEKIVMRQAQNELAMITTAVLSEEIDTVNQELSVFSSITGKVLMQGKVHCTSLEEGFGCINVNDSFVRVKSSIVTLDLKIKYLKKADFFLVSCQPKLSDYSISIFHNQHAKVQDNLLAIQDFLISPENLALGKEERRSLNDEDFYLKNIIFTFDEKRIGLTCKNPELLFTSGNQRFNCTTSITWVSLTEGLEIHSVRGSITHSETRQPHLNKKSKFLQNYEKLNGNNLELIKNDTTGPALHEVWLERLQGLSPVETAAISVGSGAAILTCLCCMICIWKINFPCCRKNPTGVQTPTENNIPTREEVFQRSQNILEGYLDRLRRGSVVRAPQQ